MGVFFCIAMSTTLQASFWRAENSFFAYWRADEDILYYSAPASQQKKILKNMPVDSDNKSILSISLFLFKVLFVLFFYIPSNLWNISKHYIFLWSSRKFFESFLSLWSSYCLFRLLETTTFNIN